MAFNNKLNPQMTAIKWHNFLEIHLVNPLGDNVCDKVIRVFRVTQK